MSDSHYVLPPALRARRVYRAPGMLGTEAPLSLDSPESDERDSVAASEEKSPSTAEGMGLACSS
jgi:hypothetical protein